MIVRPSMSRASIRSWVRPSSLFSEDTSEHDDDDSDDRKALVEFFDFNDTEEPEPVVEDNVIKRVLNNEAYCFDPVYFAELFVDAIISEAKHEILTNKVAKPCGQNTMPRQYSEGAEFYFSETTDNFIFNWPKISQFNIKVGQERLENYLNMWDRSEDWYFCVDFLGFESEDCSNVFVYEVEWSKPTMSYPIPQVTASVFFAMEVYKMVPHTHDRPIEVSYIFECSNVIHKPGKIDFQEKWLEDIIEAKLKFFKSITFGVSVVGFWEIRDFLLGFLF